MIYRDTRRSLFNYGQILSKDLKLADWLTHAQMYFEICTQNTDAHIQ